MSVSAEPVLAGSYQLGRYNATLGIRTTARPEQ